MCTISQKILVKKLCSIESFDEKSSKVGILIDNIVKIDPRCGHATAVGSEDQRHRNSQKMLLKNIRDMNSLQQQRVYLYFLKEAKKIRNKKSSVSRRDFSA